MTSKKILVYVQAVPASISNRAKNFKDLSSENLRMSHSSKAALDKAARMTKEIVALGHSSILREALARGAKEAKPLPLCDDPLTQAESINDFLIEPTSVSILVGENLDGPFSGAALCGALASVYDLSLTFDSDSKNESNGSVVLLKDSGTETFNIDIRTIDYASSKEFPESAVDGNSTLVKNQSLESTELLKEQSPNEIASTISRKLRRLSTLN